MDDLKAALSALTNRKVEIDMPTIKGIYLRPLPNKVILEILADLKGETEDERDDDYHMSTLSYSMVNDSDEQIFTKDEFKKWYAKADDAIIKPIIDGFDALNDFSGKSTEAKKK